MNTNRRLLISALLFSLLLHLAVYFNFAQIQTPSLPIEIELEILESKVTRPAALPTVVESDSKPRPVAGHLRPAIKAHPTIKKLLPSYQLKAGASAKPSVAVDQGREQVRAMNHILDTDLSESLELQSFFAAIGRRINVSVEYPKDFVRQRETGRVSIELLVDQRGRFAALKSMSSSESLLLKAYTLAAVYSALAEPLDRRVWAVGEERLYPVTVIVGFSVDTFQGKGSQLILNGPVVEIKRVGHDEALANRFISKVFERYIPPIIPVPGGFYVDFIRLYRWIENIDAPDPDMMRKERLAMTRETLEQAVKKIEASP